MIVTAPDISDHCPYNRAAETVRTAGQAGIMHLHGQDIRAVDQQIPPARQIHKGRRRIGRRASALIVGRWIARDAS